MATRNEEPAKSYPLCPIIAPRLRPTNLVSISMGQSPFSGI
jgi:hypothetical protein